MSTNNKVTNIGQNSGDPITDNLYFIAHEHEPVDNHKSITPDDIKQELFENRFFLKRRVWRNMRKVRRHPQIEYRYSRPGLKTLKPRRSL